MIFLSVSLLAWAAFSSGNPIICPRTRGDPDVLSDGNGNFGSEMESSNPGLLEELALNGQRKYIDLLNVLSLLIGSRSGIYIPWVL